MGYRIPHIQKGVLPALGNKNNMPSLGRRRVNANPFARAKAVAATRTDNCLLEVRGPSSVSRAKGYFIGDFVGDIIGHDFALILRSP